MCAGLALLIYSKTVSNEVSEALEYGLVGVNEGIISTEARPEMEEAHSPNYKPYIC